MVARRGAPLLALALVAGCGGSAAPRAPASPSPSPSTRSTAVTPTLERASCPAVARGFRCSTLAVPLRHGDPHGPTLRLRIAAARGPAPRGVLVALTGGPGQPGVPFARTLRRRLGPALRGYRLVVLDQRGTGERAVACPALQRAVGASDVTVPPAGAVRACAAGLGDRRGAYATAATVEDLDLLRRALGARALTLVGTSYGTFVAERYALAHPDATARLVLDSVVPEQGAELLYRASLRATGRVLREVCATRTCPGDPVADLRRVLARRPALAVPLFDALVSFSIGAPDLPMIPEALHRAAGGDRGLLSRVIAVGVAHRVGADQLSAGLHAATLCADSPAPWGGADAPEDGRPAALRQAVRAIAPAETAPFPPAVAARQGLVPTCLHWPAMPAPPAPPAGPIRAPALLLAGTRDLSTPLEWARGQARRMADAELVVVPGAGHAVLSSAGPRARRAIGAFLSA